MINARDEHSLWTHRVHIQCEFTWDAGYVHRYTSRCHETECPYSPPVWNDLELAIKHAQYHTRRHNLLGHMDDFEP